MRRECRMGSTTWASTKASSTWGPAATPEPSLLSRSVVGAGAWSKPVISSLNSLLITCDIGGSNNYRFHLWKIELQRPIIVLHYPPGCSKWNQIKHRMFSFISINWRGKPLIGLTGVQRLIEATTTNTGLRVRCELDTNIYKTGQRFTKVEMEELVNLVRLAWHKEWNYFILPRRP